MPLRKSPLETTGKLVLKKGDTFQIIARQPTKNPGKADWIKVQKDVKKDSKDGFQGWLRESPGVVEVVDADGNKLDLETKLKANKSKVTKKGNAPNDDETSQGKGDEESASKTADREAAQEEVADLQQAVPRNSG